MSKHALNWPNVFQFLQICPNANGSPPVQPSSCTRKRLSLPFRRTEMIMAFCRTSVVQRKKTQRLRGRFFLFCCHYLLARLKCKRLSTITEGRGKQLKWWTLVVEIIFSFCRFYYIIDIIFSLYEILVVCIFVRVSLFFFVFFPRLIWQFSI